MPKEPTPTNISYHPPEPLSPSDKQDDSSSIAKHNPTLSSAPRKATKGEKLLASAAAGAAIIAGGAQVAESASNSEVDPVVQTTPSAAENAPQMHVEGIEVGDRFMVLNQVVQFSTDRVRMRTSPTVEGDVKTGEPDNIADTPAHIMPGAQTITILHPIVVEDDINPSNGSWLGGTDSDGKLYWVNLGALRQSGYEINDTTTEVSVTEITTNGIIGHPVDGGGEVTLATIVAAH